MRIFLAVCCLWLVTGCGAKDSKDAQMLPPAGDMVVADSAAAMPPAPMPDTLLNDRGRFDDSGGFGMGSSGGSGQGGASGAKAKARSRYEIRNREQPRETPCPYNPAISSNSAECVAPAPAGPPPCQFNPSISATDPNCVAAMLRPIYFSDSSALIRVDAEATLQALLRVLQTNPQTFIRIEGNANDARSESYNLVIGMRRAAAAKAWLEQYGISASRMEMISYGDERPVCTDRDETCRQQNRRVDFSIATGPSVPDPKLDAFGWPPARPTKMERIPARLCNDAANRTLGGSETKIRAAFRRAQYPDNMRTYMIGTDGIAVVGAMEAISQDARYLPGNRRFIQPTESRVVGFDIAEFLRELFARNTGRYRVIVIALTARATQGKLPEPNADSIRNLPVGGNIGSLPPSVAGRPAAVDTPCYAIVYEFERPQDPAKIKVVQTSSAEAKVHIINAGLWPARELNQ